MSRPILCSTTLLALAVLLPAAEPAVTREGRGVTLRTADGWVRVQADAERRFHVTAGPGAPQAERASYVVITPPEAVPVTVGTEGPTLTVATATLTARIDRATGAVTFVDPQGAVVLAEQSRRFAPSTAKGANGLLQIEQTFATQQDEGLYGLGQQQDGHWDWRGLPVELTQHNTVIAVPMLVSSRGYGVLWDSAAKTTVNPIDHEVPLSGGATPDADGPKATEDLDKAKKKQEAPKRRAGSFTAATAGEYAVFVTDGDRRNHLSIRMDGAKVIEQRNMWLPYTLTGTVTLTAGQTVRFEVDGGGGNTKLFVAPRDRARTTLRSTAAPSIDYRLFYGPDLNRVVAEYRTATGPAPLWPRWAFGFWQCRERYSSQQEWVDVISRFRQEGLPVDLIVQDWQYWGKYGWGAYQWDEKHYPDPKAAIAKLHEMHTKLMVSVWPNTSSQAKDALNKIPNGFVGSFYDAYNPAARSTRWSILKANMFDIGVDAWWQDAAEPGDPGTDVEGNPTAMGPGSQHRLAYPLFHSQCIYDGQRAANNAKRVVNLTRSGYPGMQRYSAAAWSGDINGDWITFRRQIPAGLNYTITGLPYWTTDCGGFFRPGNQHQDENFNDLQRRWFQYSTFSPILRMHGYKTKTEPWEWLPATQAVMKAYTALRYRLLPYHYSVGAAVTFQGASPMRALVMDFPTDAQARAVSDQFLCGPAFLVSPVTEPKAVARPVYLPAGTPWIDFWTGATVAGGQTITVEAPTDRLPLHVRAGSIVPLGPVVQYADEKPDAPLEIRVYPGADGSFTLYDDAGDGYAYEQGEKATIPLTWNDATKTLTIGARQGTYPGMPATRTFRVVLVGPQAGIGGSETEGIPLTSTGAAVQHTWR